MNTMHSELLMKEAKRLFNLGFAIHWLKPKDKRPVKAGWTTGPRESALSLKKSYKPGYNVGVRLGEVSNLVGKDGLITNTYLAVVDCDVKSPEPHHQKEMMTKLRALFGGDVGAGPAVASGRGNGSAHFYVRVGHPFRTRRLAQSAEKVKVKMPSVEPSAYELKTLSKKELKEGWRLKPAWEISLMCEGSQVVLPPSVHPDSGKLYKWSKALKTVEAIPCFKTKDLPGKADPEEAKEHTAGSQAFKPVEVVLGLSDLSPRIIRMIEKGEGVEDRSAALFSSMLAMVSCHFTDDEILSVLTDKENWLSQCAYDHAKTKNRARAARWLRRYTLKRARKEADASAHFEAEVEEVSLSPKEAKAQARELLVAKNWKDELERRSKDDSSPKANFHNMTLILENCVKGPIFTRDLFKIRDTYGVNAPWGVKAGSMVTDDDIIRIKAWVTERYRFEPSRNLVSEAVTYAALKHSRHPVQEYLAGLRWDGKERIHRWLYDYMGARGVPKAYLRAISTKTLCAMVARILEPGLKFDHILVMEGAQGIGKSTAGRILAGEEWFCDTLPDIRDKDAMLNLQGAWVVEIGELATLRRADSETHKAFLSRQVDRVRPPYGERWIDVPRQCIFLGTTNPGSYLKDKTGNRRFWPVQVGQCDFKGLEKARDQLLAEAVETYEVFAEKLWLEGDAKKQAESIQQLKVGEDESSFMQESLRNFIKEEEKKPPLEQFNLERFHLQELFDGPVAPLGKWRESSFHLQLAGEALRQLGYQKWLSNGRALWGKNGPVRGRPKKGRN